MVVFVILHPQTGAYWSQIGGIKGWGNKPHNFLTYENESTALQAAEKIPVDASLRVVRCTLKDGQLARNLQ